MSKVHIHTSQVPVLAIVIIYLLLTLPELDKWPPLTYDECWIGSVGYNLFENGRFSTHVFGDFLQLNQISLDRLPLHSYLQAAAFEMFGFGIWQLRLPSALMGLGVVLITFQMVRSWLGIKWAAVGATILMFGRFDLVEPVVGIGILDVAMNARHDITVAFFSTWSIKSFIEAEKNARLIRHLESGIALGLALLTHFYVLILLAAFVAFWFFSRGRPSVPWKNRLALLATTTTLVLPWLILVATKWEIAKPQLLFFQGVETAGKSLGRFSFTDIDFYVTNLSREYLRYSSLFSHGGVEILPVIFVILSLIGFVQVLNNDVEIHSRFLSVALPLSLLLLAAFETFKYPAYLTFMLPLWTVAILLGLRRIWRLKDVEGIKKYLVYNALGIVICLFVFQGIHGIYGYLNSIKTKVTFARIDEFFSEIIPANTTIVGSLRYWPAFRRHTFYDYQIPTARARSLSFLKSRMSLREWFLEVRPDFLIYDFDWHRWAFEYKSQAYADPLTRKQLQEILESMYELDHKKAFPGYGEISVFMLRKTAVRDNDTYQETWSLQ